MSARLLDNSYMCSPQISLHSIEDTTLHNPRVPYPRSPGNHVRMSGERLQRPPQNHQNTAPATTPCNNPPAESADPSTPPGTAGYSCGISIPRNPPLGMFPDSGVVVAGCCSSRRIRGDRPIAPW